jgi:SRSO17 transposase
MERDVLMSRIAGRFARVETRRTAGRMVDGLMSELPTKNCWSLAEHAGDRSPDVMQHLLSAARWDHDGVLRDVGDYAVERLGDREVVAVLDETGDMKKGTRTVGVQRQYTGTAGRIENSQVAVFLSYATALGRTLIDAELYLPKSWTADPDRCAAAGVPDDVEFATKPALAWKMLARALEAGVALGWVAGDEVYGADPRLRGELESRGIGYALAVACNRQVTTCGLRRVRVDELVAALPGRAWRTLSAGDGAKGRRLYQWARVAITAEATDHPAAPGRRWLLARRNRSTGEIAYYLCFSVKSVPWQTLVSVAGRRWSIEENFQAAKTLVGLDQHQVRTWTSWRRWTILCILALTLLTLMAIAADQPTAGLIALTRNEIRRLITTTTHTPNDQTTHRHHWSIWRRRHQYRARTSHYQRQTTQQAA